MEAEDTRIYLRTPTSKAHVSDVVEIHFVGFLDYRVVFGLGHMELQIRN